MDEAFDRAHRREQLFRRPSLSRRLQAQEHREDARDACARNGDVRLVVRPDRPDARFRHTDGRLADAGRKVLREQPDGTRH